MKTNIFAFLKFLTSTFLTATLIVVLITILLWVFPGILPFSNNQVVTATTSVALPTVSVTAVPLDYNDALHTYELVATAAIQSSERALNLMVAMFTAIIGLAALAAGVASSIYKTARESGDKAKLAELSAQSAKISAENANQQMITLSRNYIDLNNRFTDTLQSYMEIRNKTLSLDAAIQAREEGIISQERYVEAQQWNSWHKWVDLQQDTGWRELKVHRAKESGLVPAIRVAIEMELARFRGKTDTDLSKKEKEYKEKLISLLEMKSKNNL
jgi:hypothetical protein